MPENKESIRLLVCGPRDFPDRSAVYKAICDITNALTVGPPDVIMHGDCKRFDEDTGRELGVDEYADDWARAWNVQRLPFPADWKTLGKKAGPIRNQRMIDEGKPNLVLAIQYKGRKTPGTQDMIRRARKAGIRTEVVEAQICAPSNDP